MLKLRFIGDDVLRREAAEITNFDSDLSRIVDDMAEIMHDNDGIGLAAPQVGVSKRLILVDISPVNEDSRLHVFVNPVILEASGESTLEEGCLSIPGVREEVTRPDSVLIKYQTIDGEQKTESFNGWMARVIQHEIDHLDGILFIDHLSPVKQKLILNSFS